MDPSRIAQTALYQEVAERLRQRIFAHQLPRERIDEQALAIDYGISRTPCAKR
jgi:DNA-binding GntR family transcriptional regulator